MFIMAYEKRQIRTGFLWKISAGKMGFHVKPIMKMFLPMQKKMVFLEKKQEECFDIRISENH